ncbi:MAG: hypothetical protein AB7Q37_15640 [Pyrinomonadaceae bacterium]
MGLQVRSRPSYSTPNLTKPLSGRFYQEIRRGSPVVEADDRTAATLVETSALPVLATASDAREFVRFLRRRPNGVTVVEAMNAEPRRIFDARKVAAYEFWGIAKRENERLSLTELGIALAEVIDPECRINRRILNSVPAYRIALDHIFHDGLDLATHPDVIRYWSELRTIAGIDDGRPHDLEAAVVCFFSICHAAELGTSTVGKRGQPARLRVDMEQLGDFLSEAELPIEAEQERPSPEILLRPAAVPVEPLRRVLVSSSRPIPAFPVLSSFLELAGFEGAAEERVDYESGLLPSSELNEMQRCQAAIFVIGPADCVKHKDGSYSLKPDRITRISVASALFDWRIVVFWQGPPPPPNQLIDSGLKVVSGDQLDWEACMNIASLIKELA